MPPPLFLPWRWTSVRLRGILVADYVRKGIAMLQLLLGRSGTGKTEEIYRLLTDEVWSDAPEKGSCILLVPEQFSFESERTLLERLGPRMASGVLVLSFTRLADTIFRELGGLAGRRMDDPTRALLMSQALEQVAPHLTLYRRHTANPEYIQSMLALLSECKQCAIPPAQLEQAADGLDGTLHAKCRELALILEAYDALAAQSYLDPLDDLTRLAQRMGDSHLLDGATVFIDGFKGFTQQELQVLGGILRKASRVTVTLCTDTLEDKSHGFGLFSPVIRTANRLIELARQQRTAVAKPRILTENHRTADPALRFLEAGCFLPRPAVLEQPAASVTVTPCGDIYRECQYVARTIRRLLRENGGRCRDIALVTRDLSAYTGLLDAALEQEGIPCYLDRRDSILTDPLITLTLAALRAATDGYATDDLLTLLKTGLAGFSTSSVSLVENYVFLWRINGSRWRQEWTWNPEGLSVQATEATDKQLAHLNRLRRRLIRPLERLQAALSGHPTGADFAHAVYRYLLDIHADRLVRLQVARLDAAGEHALADRQARLWDVLMNLLDKFAAALAHTPLSAARLLDLLRLAAQITDLGVLPQSLDAVQIGSADRMRFSAPKTVFLLGVNEGVFPAYPAASGLLTDDERRTLIARGLPMADASDLQAVEERFFAYAALSAPSERLFLTYPQTNAAGETLAPSLLVDTVRRILPQCTIGVDRREDGQDLESEAEGFEQLAARWREPSPLTAALRSLFAEQPAYAHRLSAIARSAEERPAAFTDEALARRFFGNELRLSASRVEKYHQCRFAYFCQYGLKAKARKPADLNAAEFGTLTHYVMEHRLPEYTALGFAHVRREQVFADAAATVRQYVDDCMGGMENKTERFAHLVDRLSRTSGALLWHVVRELRQSQFVPVDYELSIGMPDENGNRIEPVVLTLPDGATVQVQGKVDRVDVFHKDGRAYVRVIDYKTGSKEFRLDEVVEGINVQMLLYILTIWQNGGPRYGTVTPAGVLYLPAKLPVLRIDRDADEAAAERERTLAMRMNGLLLDDSAIVQAMEHDAAGLFIPASLDKNGNCKGKGRNGDGLATLEQFGQLKKRMETLLTAMAQTLRQGDIAALPASGANVDACAYCDYKAVCGHEPEDPIRAIAKKDHNRVLADLAADTAPEPAK